MAYLGVPPQSGFITTAKQRITSSTNNYVDLDHSISSLADVIVWVNFVKQDSTNLTLTNSTRITLGATLVASDIVEIAYLGKAVATQNPSTNSVTNDMLAGSIANSKLANPFNSDQAQTFNESGAAVDFRVESDNNANAFIVDGSADRVGFGIAAPETEMHIQSTSGECELRLTAGDTSDARLRFGDTTTTAGGYIGYNRSTQNMYIRSANSGSAHLSIQNTGTRIAIGVDSPDDVRLHVKSPNQQCIKTERTGTGNSGHITFKNPNGTVGEIVTNGSSTSYLTSSDYRLKENQVAISDGIERLKNLKPYRFNFKTDKDEEGNVTKTVDGFFAHEVTPVVPEAISGEKDAEEMQGIDQAKLVPLLTSALQEAITKIETLEARVQALENE
jgi:hypothetical protein